MANQHIEGAVRVSNWALATAAMQRRANAAAANQGAASEQSQTKSDGAAAPDAADFRLPACA